MLPFAGPDERDQSSLPAERVDYVKALRGSLEGLRVAYAEDLGFADVVVAQQSLLNAVTQYILVLTEQWNAFVDIAALLQIESLRELQLDLREKDSSPEPIDGAAAGTRRRPSRTDSCPLAGRPRCPPSRHRENPSRTQLFRR